MKVKELLQKLNDGLQQNKITEDTDVIILGYYSLGDDIGSLNIYDNMIRTGEDPEEDGKPQTVVSLSVECALHETYDFRDSTMWMDYSDYEEMKEDN